MRLGPMSLATRQMHDSSNTRSTVHSYHSKALITFDSKTFFTILMKLFLIIKKLYTHYIVCRCDMILTVVRIVEKLIIGLILILSF